MKFLKGILIAALALCSMTPALAADVTVDGPGRTYPPNIFLYQTRAVDLSTNYSNSSTTATIIASASGTTAVTVPATTQDFSKQYIRVCWRAVGSKATSTTGTISLFVNGAVLASSAQAISVASLNGNVSGCATVARSSAAAQTVSLYGVSGDTAAFTVSAAYIEVWNITFG